MKRLFACLLAMVMVLSLAACGGAESPATTEATDNGTEPQAAASFTVGYGREKFTPKNSVQLYGYGGDERLSTNVLDDVYITCVAMTDAEGNTLILYSADLCSSDGQTTKQVIRKTAKEYGIPEENVYFSSTHNHSAPALASVSDLVMNAAMASSKAALDSRKPAKMYIGTRETVGLNFVRHYEMEDGEVIGDNHGIPNGRKYKGHVTEADNQMQLIRFEREGAKDVVMMNFQAHLNMAAKDFTSISADFVGYCRTAIEKKMDCEFMFLQGACGNLNPTSYIADETASGDRNPVKHGELLAEAAYNTMDKMQPAELGLIQVKTAEVPAKHADNEPGIVAQMPKWQEVFDATGSAWEAREASGGMIDSKYELGAISSRASKAGQTTDVHIAAMTIGDVSFLSAPYEMFDTNGMYIKDNDKYDITFIMCYSSGECYGYIPSDAAFDYGCYEVDTRVFERGTAEDLANKYVELLNELHG